MTYVPDPCFRFTPLLFILLPTKRTFVSLMPFSAQSHALFFLSSVSLLCFLAFPHTCPSPPTHIYIVIRLICPALPASSVAINTLFDVVSCTSFSRSSPTVALTFRLICHREFPINPKSSSLAQDFQSCLGLSCSMDDQSNPTGLFFCCR